MSRSGVVGSARACALLDNNTSKCWGGNTFSDPLGLGVSDLVKDIGDGPGEMGAALAPLDLGTGRTAVSLSVGERHAGEILDNGSVKCWGSTLDDGAVSGWGWNAVGLLGRGSVSAGGREREVLGRERRWRARTR